MRFLVKNRNHNIPSFSAKNNSRAKVEILRLIYGSLSNQTKDLYELYEKSGVAFEWPYSQLLFLSYLECFVDLPTINNLNFDMYCLYYIVLEKFPNANISIGELDKLAIVSIRIELENGLKFIIYRKKTNLIRIEIRLFKDYLKQFVNSGISSEEQFIKVMEKCRLKAFSIIKSFFDSAETPFIKTKRILIKEISAICGEKAAEDIILRMCQNNGSIKVTSRQNPGLYKNIKKLRSEGILRCSSRSRYRFTEEYLKIMKPYFIGIQLMRVGNIHNLHKRREL
jgi:hypothetical protein